MSQVALRACCAVAKVFERQPTVASAALVAALHGIHYQYLYQGRTFSIFELEVPDSDSKRGGRCLRVLVKAGPMELALLGATVAEEELHLAGYLHLVLKEAAKLCAGEGFFELYQDNFSSSEQIGCFAAIVACTSCERGDFLEVGSL